MKKDIILAGVGGQGILSIAAVIGFAAVDLGLHIKQAEVHGMSQRGGDVQSHFRLSDNEIMSDLIPYGKADMIISVEPMESLRYLPMLGPDGWLITSTDPYVNIQNYPDVEQLLIEVRNFKNHVALPADEMAREIKFPKSANMIILGAASPNIGIEVTVLEKAIQKLFRTKGDEVIEGNIKALHAGLDFAKQYKV